MKKTIAITVLPENEFDLKIPHQNQDAHLRFEDGAWMIDLFDSRKHPAHAHLETTRLESAGENCMAPDWNEVFQWILE